MHTCWKRRSDKHPLPSSRRKSSLFVVHPLAGRVCFMSCWGFYFKEAARWPDCRPFHPAAPPPKSLSLWGTVGPAEVRPRSPVDNTLLASLDYSDEALLRWRGEFLLPRARPFDQDIAGQRISVFGKRKTSQLVQNTTNLRKAAFQKGWNALFVWSESVLGSGLTSSQACVRLEVFLSPGCCHPVVTIIFKHLSRLDFCLMTQPSGTFTLCIIVKQ